MSLEPVAARALWIASAGACEIRSQTLASRQADDVLVQTRFSAISRGTESLVLRGKVPKSEYQRMRCPFQEGDFPGPVKYGYANVGAVVEGPSDLVGKHVFCLYPHQTAYVVPKSAVALVPEGVPPERAVLAANLETALNGIWDARPLLGDRITVVGAGVVGCLSAYLARKIMACEVELIDVRAERATVARALGVSFATPENARSERDLVVHASGTAGGLNTALSLAAPDATVVELSWFGSDAVALPLGEAFHARRLTLRSSQVGSVSPNARPRWTPPARRELALRLCGDAALDALIDGESRFDELPAAMMRVASVSSGALCHRVRYD